MENISKWFWADSFWLPAGISFKDLQDKPGFHYAKPADLYLLPLWAICIFCIRRVFDYFCTPFLAYHLGVKDTRKRPQPNFELEKTYQSTKVPSSKKIENLSKKLDWSESKILVWFRRRRNMDRPSLVQKLSEASWRCFFYTVAFTFGIVLLVQAPWFWDNLYCWVDYPRQSMWQSVYYYYMLEGGFYISLLFSIMNDVKRKDFTEQLIHHMATIFLIVFSYVANFVRIGSMVMAIHDISDVILELAKCFVYAKKAVWADNLFTLFAVVFIISRLIIYPYCVIHTTWVKSMWLFKPYAGYYFFNALLMILQILHIFWAAIIIKMAIRMVMVGKVEKDARSDVEEESDEYEDEQSSSLSSNPQSNGKVAHSET
uniref:Homeobox domain-containing protein n=1 Tax=Ciona savignyi TaxID=51511 RepID=H2ZH54_CIOSA